MSKIARKFHQSKALKYCEVADALMKRKVATPAATRLDQLMEIEKQVESQTTPLLKVALVNLEPEFSLDTKGQFDIEIVRLEMDLDNAGDWKKIRGAIKDAVGCQVVILGVRGHGLTSQERGLLSACFMSGRAAIVYWPSCVIPEQYAESLTLKTWPVITEEEELHQYVRDIVPKRIKLFNALVDDLSAKVEKHKKVNVPGHLISRIPISLVPFGLVGFNSFRTLKLVRKVLRDTGLQLDESNTKAVVLETGKAAIKSTSVESTSDVFQAFVAASVLSDITADLLAGGITAAAEGVELADALLVGAAGAVGGIASTVGQCLSRPVLVQGLASLAAMMQLVYLINPAMRRPMKEGAEASTSKDDQDDADSD